MEKIELGKVVRLHGYLGQMKVATKYDKDFNIKSIKQIIDEIATKEAMKTEQKILEQPASAYKIMKSVEEMAEVYPGKIPLKEKREIDKMTTALSEIIPGNIR